MIARRVGVLATLLVVTTATHALGLEEAFVEALRSNPEIQAAREIARSAHENVPLSIGNWLPTLQLRSAAGFSRIEAVGESVNNGQKTLELAYSQNLYAGGRRRQMLRQAEEEVRQAHAAVEDVEHGVLLRVATAYLDVLRAGQVVELRKASLDVLAERSREAKAQFDVGDRTRADVAQADSEWGIAVADVASAQAELETQRALLETLVGVRADEVEVPDPVVDLPDSLQAAQRTAMRTQPAVRAAGYAFEAAGHAVRVAEGESGPRIDLEGSLGRTIDDIYPFYRTETRLGVRLMVPLYQAGSSGVRLRQARNRQRQRRAELLAAQREASRLVTSAWNDLNAARERYRALHEVVEASKVALVAVQREASVGERTTREVLDAQGSVVSNQVRLLSTNRDILVSTYRILAAMGALTARVGDIEGVPDLELEARETRWNLAPAFLPGWLF